MRSVASQLRTTTTGLTARGFSLIEVIVVCVMLALLAATIVPRLIVVQRQREDKAILEVSDLLRMYAFRNTAGTQQIGLYHNPAENQVAIWIYDLNPSNPEGPRIWQEDRLSSPVTLPDGMVIASATADGLDLYEDVWTIPTHPDGSRPRIELELVGTEKSALIVLENYTSVPTRSDVPRAVAREPIDLDSIGGTYDRW